MISGKAMWKLEGYRKVAVHQNVRNRSGIGKGRKEETWEKKVTGIILWLYNTGFFERLKT